MKSRIFKLSKASVVFCMSASLLFSNNPLYAMDNIEGSGNDSVEVLPVNDESSKDTEVSEAELRAKNYILYAINCGSSAAVFPTNSIDRAEQFQNISEKNFPERFVNQLPDQVYNDDPSQDSDIDCKYSWGIVDPDSKINPVKRNTGGNGWPYDTNWQTNVGSKENAKALQKTNPDYDQKGGITYRFEIPKRADKNAVNKYNVRLGFHTGGRNRFLNVYANDEKKIDSLLLVANVKYVEGFQTEAVVDEKTGRSFIEIRVAANTSLNEWLDGNNDVQVKYLEITAESVYTYDDVTKLLDQTKESDLKPLKSGYQDDGKGTSSFTAPYDSYEVNKHDLASLKEARNQAAAIKQDATANELYDVYTNLKNAFDNARFIYHYTGITGTNGAKQFDNNGNLIQGHGPQIQAVSIDTMPASDQAFDKNGDGKLWVWCGEDKTNGLLPSGVHIYYSDDLYNWVDKGLGFSTYNDEADFKEKCKDKNSVYGKYYNVDAISQDEDFKNIYGEDFKAFADDSANYNMSSPQDALDNVKYDLSVGDSAVYERPKMIFNEQTRRWVIWYHADGPIRGNPTSGSYSKAKAGVAISETADPAGPYKYLGSFRMSTGRNGNNPGMARDMNLFVDDKDANDDGVLDAYLIYASNENRDLTISLLDSTYTKLATPRQEESQGTDIAGGDTYNIIATNSKESPAPIKYNGKYYIIYSGTTGWAPNTNKYAVSDGDNILGPYHEVGNPFVSGSSINQSNSNAFTTQSSSIIPYNEEKGQYIYFGDRWFNPDDNRDISQSRYIMTPMQFVNGELKVLPAADWKTNDLEQYSSLIINSEFPKETGSMSEYIKNLPDQIEVQIGNLKAKTPVIWEPYFGANTPIGSVTVTGKLPEYNNTKVSVKVEVYPENTKLFIDSGSNPKNESTYFNKLKDFATDLINKDSASDQKKNADNNWGYTSSLGGDNDNVDMSKYGTDSNDIYQTGYWAHSGKNITYQAELEAGTYTINAGYKDWWNSRKIKFTVANGDKELGSTTLDVTASNKMTNDITFTLSEKAVITMTTSKSSGGDPVLSWIAVRETKNSEIVTVSPVKDVITYLQDGKVELPEKVEVTTAAGNKIKKAVKWYDSALDSSIPFKVINLQGQIDDTTLPANVKVQMIPTNLEYYIDCNGGKSSTYQEVAKNSNLQNKVADQIKTDENTWGNTSIDSGVHNGDNIDPYSSGWYGNDGTLSYQLTLPAGVHEISMGFKDWWNVSRPTQVSCSYDGQDSTVLFNAAVNGNESIKKATIKLQQEQLVTITLTSSEGGGPVLSWLSAKDVTPHIEATGIEVDVNEADLNKGEEVTVKAIIKPTNSTDSLSWSTSNPAVATVENGVIKAIDKGNAIITVTANDNVKAEIPVLVSDFTKGDLEELISSALNGLPDNINLKAFLQKEIDNAQTKLNETGKSLREVYDSLLLAIEKVNAIQKDIDAINSYIKIDLSIYEETGTIEFIDILQTAIKLLEDPINNQESIGKTVDRLEMKFSTLIELKLQELQEAIKQAEEIDLMLYEDNDANDIFVKVLNKAQALEPKSNLEITVIIQELKDASVALTKKQLNGDVIEKPGDSQKLADKDLAAVNTEDSMNPVTWFTALGLCSFAITIIKRKDREIK